MDKVEFRLIHNQKGKLSLRAHFFQFERIQKNIFKELEKECIGTLYSYTKSTRTDTY